MLDDPLAALSLAIWFLAVGMYPVGILLGATCSPCCCGCPDGETLPEAITASFSGLTQSAVKVSNGLPLSITACFGSGAAGVANAPPGGGAISSVTKTAGGSGYAVLGRAEPSGLTISGGSGSDATFTVDFTETTDACGRPVWEIDSVSVVDGGSGYVDGESLSVTLGEDEFQATAATLTLQTALVAPDLTAITSGSNPGTGAVFQVNTVLASSNPNRYAVDSVTVLNGGSGYTADTLFFLAGPSTVTVTIAYGSFTVNGTTGAIESVTITTAGSYYDTSTAVGAVSVTGGGKFYKEDASLPAIAATVTVSVLQSLPHNSGTGASITAVVNDTVGSATFGQLSFSVANGGSNYQGPYYTISDCCVDFFNDNVFLLRRVGTSCDYQKVCCERVITVTYRGPSFAPKAEITGHCSIVFEGDQADQPFPCDGFAFVGTEPLGGTITVEEAAAEEPDTTCPPCCVGADPDIDETPCTSEECLAANGTWFNTCECQTCSVDCPDVELIVDISADCFWEGDLVTHDERTETIAAANGVDGFALVDFPPPGGCFNWNDRPGLTLQFVETPFGCGVAVNLKQGPAAGVICCSAEGSIALPTVDGCPIDGAEGFFQFMYEAPGVSFVLTEMTVTVTLVT